MKNYDKLDLQYVEKAIAMEEFYIHNPGKVKFYIPALTPFLPSNDPSEKSLRVSKSHLVNKNKSMINASSTIGNINYIEIELPNWITAEIKDVSVESKISGCTAPEHAGDCNPGEIETKVTKTYFLPIDDREYVPKGIPFLVTFIGGDMNKPQIIGRYV